MRWEWYEIMQFTERHYIIALAKRENAISSFHLDITLWISH